MNFSFSGDDSEKFRKTKSFDEQRRRTNRRSTGTRFVEQNNSAVKIL